MNNLDRPLILVTNDDGVHAPGIKALFTAMQKIGTPVIVAPTRDNSAVSHSLTMTRPLRVKKMAEDIFTLDGTPADCVILGMEKILPHKPALVVSGINNGGNLCEDISYSGTVSAAIEGTMMGVPSIAFSIPGEAPFYFETAASVARDLACKVLEKGLPKDTLLNINVPNIPSAEEIPVVFTKQGKRVYADVVKETSDPWGREHYWIGGGTPSWDKEKGTDSATVMADKISITPIHLDLTNYDALDYLRNNW